MILTCTVLILLVIILKSSQLLRVRPINDLYKVPRFRDDAGTFLTGADVSRRNIGTSRNRRFSPIFLLPTTGNRTRANWMWVVPYSFCVSAFPRLRCLRPPASVILQYLRVRQTVSNYIKIPTGPKDAGVWDAEPINREYTCWFVHIRHRHRPPVK